jgi:hypothetical protein
MMFISDANAKRAIVKWSGGQCSVDLGQQKQRKRYVAEEITDAFYWLNGAGNHLAWASCTRLSQPTVMLDMVVGRVVVPPDLPVGSVILTRDWTMSARRGKLSLYFRHQPLCGEDRVARGHGPGK